MPKTQKRPAAAPPKLLAARVVKTPLTQCKCGCRLADAETTAALCVDLIGVSNVNHCIKRCVHKNCRTRYGYNFTTIGGKHMNTIAPGDIKEGILFVGAGRCFTTRYLTFHENLMFRGFTTARAVEWAYKQTFGSDDVVENFNNMHGDALFYWMGLQDVWGKKELLYPAPGNEHIRAALWLCSGQLLKPA